MIYKFIPVNLRRFGRPEDEGRTHDPTEYRIRKAREDEGKVAKSVELTSSLLLIGTLIAALSSGSFINSQWKEEIIKIFSTLSDKEISALTVNDIFYDFLFSIVWPITPILIPAVIISILAHALQFGFFYSLKPLKWNNKRIGFRFSRVFASRQTIVNLIKSLIKVFVALSISYFVILLFSEQILGLILQPLNYAYEHAAQICLTLLAAVAFGMLVIAIPDFFFQKKEHLESLKMSHTEIRDELKQTEGNSQTRETIEQRAREIAESRMMRDIPRADVVITNPTHYAAALLYEPQKHDAPILLAKGKNLIAQRIRSIAREHHIALIENPPLAQALHSIGQVGQMIPKDLWTAVIDVLMKLGIAHRKLSKASSSLFDESELPEDGQK